VGVERKLTGTELDSLNMANVNAIRHLPGAGVVIMGGRTLKLSGSDKYVASRRTLIYIRSSLISSTRFAIFEPNDEHLWLVLRSIIERFLLDFWQVGGLRGNSADEAFYVKCDDEMNTPQSIAAGEVKVQIGVALQFPAEFVVFTLSQREVGATVTVEL
jgi:phage tail sheath protein FI